jgi:hypothetical protein
VMKPGAFKRASAKPINPPGRIRITWVPSFKNVRQRLDFPPHAGRDGQ